MDVAVSLHNKIVNIITRIGFFDTRKILSDKHGITAVSQKEFIDKYTELGKSDPNLEVSLDAIWNNLILGGERLVQLHKLEVAQIDQIDRAIKNKLSKSTINPFRKSYPYPLDSTQLGKLNTNIHVLSYQKIKVGSNNRKLDVAVLCSKANYTVNEPLAPVYLSSQGKTLLKDAEIICKQRKTTQCYDLVIIDRQNKLVSVASDTSVITSGIDAKKHLEQLKSYFRMHLGLGVLLDRPENVFPAIPNLYSKKDGRISLLTFLTSDGNPSSLRIKTLKQHCLRVDNYHKGGETKAGVLTKYKLGKLWDFKLSNNSTISPGIEIHGVKKMAEGSTDPLRHFTLLNSYSMDNTIFTIDKVFAAL